MIENETVKATKVAPTTEPGKGDVSLHIERLVVDGLPLANGSAAQLQIAVQNELTRLLAQDGLSRARQGALRSVTAPEFQFVGDAVPMELGRRIARSVYDSLNRNT